MLSFEGEKIQGAQNISNKLNSLPFQQCKHNISTVDCQPSGPAGGMLLFVSGNLQLPGEEHALKFSQVQFSFKPWGASRKGRRCVSGSLSVFLIHLSPYLEKLFTSHRVSQCRQEVEESVSTCPPSRCAQCCVFFLFYLLLLGRLAKLG
jgi:hypothetical protein